MSTIFTIIIKLSDKYFSSWLRVRERERKPHRAGARKPEENHAWGRQRRAPDNGRTPGVLPRSARLFFPRPHDNIQAEVMQMTRIRPENKSPCSAPSAQRTPCYNAGGIVPRAGVREASRLTPLFAGEEPLPAANSCLREFGSGSCRCCVPRVALGRHLRTRRGLLGGAGWVQLGERGCVPRAGGPAPSRRRLGAMLRVLIAGEERA